MFLNRFSHSVLTLLVACCLNNNVDASSADETKSNYDQEKTEQLKKLIHYHYPPSMDQLCSLEIKETLHIPIHYPQDILQLIEQGADPNAQDLSPYGGTIYKGTALHILCDRRRYIKNFPEILAKLRFFKARLDIQDWGEYTPRMLVWAERHSKADLANFDAIIAATDKVRKAKQEQMAQSRSLFLQQHLPTTLCTVVHEYNDAAFWDPTCWPAIQKEMGIPQEEAPAPRRFSFWRRK